MLLLIILKKKNINFLNEFYFASQTVRFIQVFQEKKHTKDAEVSKTSSKNLWTKYDSVVNYRFKRN